MLGLTSNWCLVHLGGIVSFPSAITFRADELVAFQHPQMVTHQLMRCLHSPRNLLLGDAMVLLYHVIDAHLDPGQAGFVRYLVAGRVETPIHTFLHGFDEPLPFQNIQVIGSGTVVQLQCCQNGGKMVTGVGLDITKELTTDEMVQNLVLFYSGIKREEQELPETPAPAINYINAGERMPPPPQR